jgi:hypothetical protein
MVKCVLTPPATRIAHERSQCTAEFRMLAKVFGIVTNLERPRGAVTNLEEVALRDAGKDAPSWHPLLGVR